MQKNPTIVSLLLIGLLALCSLSVNAQQGSRITEDDPRWDCRTMGNKICGPDAKKPVYYCGAPTKKNTACKRRVKAAGQRCWQHKAAK